MFTAEQVLISVVKKQPSLSHWKGKGAIPVSKPPFPAIQGAWLRPTVVNNVETLAAVVPIINMGGEEYAKIGVGKSTGTKLMSACGNINKPGVYEIDMTISVEEFIYSDEYCGGIPKGKRLKHVSPVDHPYLFYQPTYYSKQPKAKPAT